MKNIKFSFTLFLGVLILLFTTFSTINAVEKDPVFLKSGVELKEDIIVNGQILKVPAPYFYRGDEGIVMVPLRAIAQELGLNVAWNGNDKSVTIGYEIRVFIDQNYYMWCETYQIEFGPSPELTQNYTYVPLPFFKYAIKGCEITVSEDGSVIIDKDPSTVIWFEPNNSSYATYSDDFPEN